MQHVPYRGAAPAMQDLLAGQIDIMLDNITSALAQVRSGAVKGLGITTAKRSEFAPELQPIADVVPGFDVTSWLFTMIAFGLDNNALGGGGSAMPCGLVLPAASAQLELADLLPDVRPAALSY